MEPGERTVIWHLYFASKLGLAAQDQLHLQVWLNFPLALLAYAPLHGRSSKTLLQLADRAMYHAKNSRKGSVHEFIQQHPQVPLRFDTGFDVLPSED